MIGILNEYRFNPDKPLSPKQRKPFRIAADKQLIRCHPEFDEMKELTRDENSIDPVAESIKQLREIAAAQATRISQLEKTQERFVAVFERIVIAISEF